MSSGLLGYSKFIFCLANLRYFGCAVEVLLNAIVAFIVIDGQKLDLGLCISSAVYFIIQIEVLI